MRPLRLATLLLLAPLCSHAADVPPVKEIAPYTMHLGKADAGLFLSQEWSHSLPKVTTALIIFHGRDRNAAGYFRTGTSILPESNPESTLVIAPQFLEEVDIARFHLPATMLRWGPTAWQGGEDALTPAPVSSYEVIDAILEKLADRTLFPNLKTIVMAGHSGGGQVLARYAVVGKEIGPLAKRGYMMRFIIANPSSYLYFTPDRPLADGTFGTPHNTCDGKINNWKFGLEDRPRYARGQSAQQLEKIFLSLNVTYLLGTKDIDPNHRALDKTCPAEMQGASRMERGLNYYRYLHTQTPALKHRLFKVEGVGHNSGGMFRSPCGQFALFGTGVCTDVVP